MTEPRAEEPVAADEVANGKLPSLVRLSPADDEFVARTVPFVEQAIETLLDEFCVNPFTHRVEHSLHVQLYELLSSRDELTRHVPIGRTGFATQLIHKEWPETSPRTGKGRRGSFDLAILTPGALRRVDSIDQFALGRIEAAIVVELGLGYQDDHLTGDELKVTDSEVRHPYLVHFSRVRSRRRTAVEREIERIGAPIRVAYVHYDIDTGTIARKRLAEASISNFAS